jgi:protein-S-isoprenylcysteine O-methyltransferase Ste14
MPGNPLTDPNWAPDLANQITTLVGNVRDKTTDNAVKAVRAVVFGLLALFLGLVAVVLLLVIATRGLQSLLSLAFDWDRSVYLSYFLIGGILTLAGLLLMGKRSA